MAAQHGTIAHLLPPRYRTDVTNWLAEDCPSFDYGGFVVGDAPREARLLCKAPGILAGVPFFDEVFRQLDCTVRWHVQEGAALNMPSTTAHLATPADAPSKITHAATVHGSVRNILLGERVALNTLARCSGIATRTQHTLSLLRPAVPAGEKVPVLAGTRKTTPGFRLVEKYGMLVGGADPHRHDLSTMTMLKDNHVWACGGSIGTAVAAAKAAGGFAVKVEVECTSEAEAHEAIESGADVVMLDNFKAEEARETAARLRERYGEKKFLLEISGGLTEENLAAFARTGVDVLSTSSIHQGVPHVDFSLKIVH
jgi:nicotinate-nucleotide pyrophosphorylase (carboxylating)